MPTVGPFVDMDRRKFLQCVGVGCSTGLSVAVAGCSDGDPDGGTDPGGTDPGETDDPDQGDSPTPTSIPTDVVVTDFGHEATDDGETAVTVAVSNEGDDEETAVVDVEVTADDVVRSDDRAVTLAAGEDETLAFEFDVNLDGADFVEVAPFVRGI
ncbi:hypothetical protein BRC81_09160 [Halobacteriales archaeon QS_1_68_20]|nr:MAG: hypothetical protein BRC81_09160 [Halobacteriales archaeon QS_1_68_20]